MILIVSILILSLHKGVECNKNIDKIDILIDILEIRGISTHINAFLCWPKVQILTLSKKCFERRISLKVSANETEFLIHSLFAETISNVIDTNCEPSDMIIVKASNLSLLKKPFRWIIFGDIEKVETLNIYPGADSDLLLVENKWKEYKITTIHKTCVTYTNFFRKEVASWNAEHRIRDYLPSSLFERRRNLNRSLFTLTFWASNPITYDNVGKYRYTHIDASIQFTYIITELLTSMLNVNRTYIIHKGTLVPMLEDVKSGKAIVGATPFYVFRDRIMSMDYLAPNTPSYLYFIFRAPPLSYVSNIFTRPFDENVWYASIAVILLISVLMYVILNWEWKEEYFSRTTNYWDRTKPSADNIVLLQMGIVNQQGCDTEPKSVSGRTVFFFSLISFMFLYTAYSGMIVALLQSTSDMITTLDDILDSGIELGVENLTYATRQFTQAVDPLQKKIYVEKLKPKGEKYLMRLNDGIKKMRSEFFAFYTEQTSAYKVVSDTFQESEKCNLKEIAYFNFVEPWITATKNHSYKELMKVGLFWLKEVGFYNCERRRIFNEKPKCSGRINSFVSAGLVDTYAAFVLFGIGILFSLGVFLIELVFQNTTRE